MSEVVTSAPSGEPIPDDRPRPAGVVQATVLIAATCMIVLGVVVIAPVQPQMVRAFAGTTGVAELVSFAVTVPGLMIGLLSVFAGRLADRVGRVRLLTGALVAYTVFGTAALWLPSLPLVVASRVGVGITEAVIYTCAVTLMADLWSGPARDRLFGLHNTVAAVAAVPLIALSGLIGTGGWRAPFWLYAVGVVLAVLVARLVRDPAGLREVAEALPPLDWRPLVAPIGVTLVGGIVFFAPIVELSYKLDSIGASSAALIGLVSAIVTAANAIGAGVFGWVSWRGTRGLLVVSFVVAGVGLVVLGAGSTVVVVTVGGFVCSLGTGLLRPTLLTWALAPLDLDQRGRATGIWTSAATIGQFICPLVVLAFSAVLGGLAGALIAVGVLSLVLAVPAWRLARS